MKAKTISLQAEDQNVEEEINNADINGLENLPTATEDEDLDQEISQEIEEANEELNQSENLETTEKPEEVQETSNQAENVIEDVAEEVNEGEVLSEASQVSQDFESVFNNQSNVLGDASIISESLDDQSDKDFEKSGNIDFSSPQSSNEVSEEDLSETENEEDQSEHEEIVEFGDETGEKEENEEQEGQAEQGESAADKTKEELENGEEEASEYKEEVAEGLGKEESTSFDDVFNDAMETAIKTDPKAESVVVIAYDKDAKKPEIKNINISKFRDGTFKSPVHPENQEAADLLTDSVPVAVETDKTFEEQQMILDEKVKELEEKEIKNHLEEKKTR